MKYVLRQYQKEASDKAVQFFLDDSIDCNGVIVAATGCHAKGTKILMYDGTMKNVEDINVGDELVGDDGKKRTVLELHKGIDRMYEISPIKGEPFVVNGGHILSLYKTNEGNKYPSYSPRIDEISVEEYVNTSNTYKHLHKLRKPRFVDFGNEGKSVIEPYFLGLYLGDGCSATGVISISSQRKEIEDYLYSFADRYGMKIRKAIKPNNLASDYHFSNINVSRSNPNKIIVFLEELGLCGLTSAFKFIPTHYKTASKIDRIELLAGLLDTDSYYDASKNEYEYCTKSEQLADDIIFLCRSLGFYCSTKKVKIVNDSVYYRLIITGDINTVPTKVCIRKGKPRLQKKSVLVTGFSVKYLGKGNYYGFTIDGNNLYCDGQFFIHHNSGKSLIVSDVAYRLNSDVLVLCPSKEIIEQDYAKMKSYGVECSMYSASVGKKEISKITFCSIGSVKGHPELFSHFKYVIADECHLISNRKGTMYFEFLKQMQCKVLGLTATPFRLESFCQIDKETKKPKLETAKSWLQMITSYKKPVFKKMVHVIQIDALIRSGYLANVRYFDVKPPGWDSVTLFKNTSGSDYSDKSVKYAYDKTQFSAHLANVVRRLVDNRKTGIRRNGILVFTRFVEEAMELALRVDGCAVVSGDTPKKEREDILERFKSGDIKVVVNSQTLTTGFDFPALDTVVMARPTMSLALFYQIVGRSLRPHPSKKDAWFVDLCGNVERFGKVSDLEFRKNAYGDWNVFSKDKQLTNVTL